MSLGVALYVTGEDEKRIEGIWARIAAAGFPSPSQVAGQRPHVSLLNGEGDLRLAVDVGSQLAERFARTGPIPCELQPVAFFARARRIAFYPVQETADIRALQESVYGIAVASGVQIRDSYKPGKWVPHLSLSGDVPEHRKIEFSTAMRGQESQRPVVFGEAGVAWWERGTPLKQVALFQLDPKHLVRESYDRISHAYRGDTLPRDRGYFRWLDLLMPHLREGDAVLDLGCGCGVPMAQELAQRCDVTGIDISPIQIKRARQLVPNGTFVCRDMATAEFEEGRFTAIVSLFSMFHLPLREHRPFLARMFSWLRPGGYLFISLGHSAWTGYEMDWHGAPMYWSHADEQTSLKWLEEIGFEVLWQEFLPEGEGGHRIVLARRSSGGLDA